MKYVVIAGWKPYDEWNDFVIGIFDTYQAAIGKAYDYLDNMIESSYGTHALCNTVVTEDGKRSLERAKYTKSGRPVYIKDLVAISAVCDIHDDAGYWIEIVETKHEEHTWNGDIKSFTSNYVKILTYNNDDEKEVTDDEL